MSAALMTDNVKCFVKPFEHLYVYSEVYAGPCGKAIRPMVTVDRIVACERYESIGSDVSFEPHLLRAPNRVNKESG